MFGTIEEEGTLACGLDCPAAVHCVSTLHAGGVWLGGTAHHALSAPSHGLSENDATMRDGQPSGPLALQGTAHHALPYGTSCAMQSTVSVTGEAGG